MSHVSSTTTDHFTNHSSEIKVLTKTNSSTPGFVDRTGGLQFAVSKNRNEILKCHQNLAISTLSLPIDLYLTTVIHHYIYLFLSFLAYVRGSRRI